MPGMHMQIASIPACADGKWLCRERRVFDSRVETYVRLVVGNYLRAHVGNSDNQPPLPSWNLTRKIRRRSVRFADGEMAFVSTTLSTEALRVCDAEVQRSPLISPCVVKVDADAVYTGRYCERDLKVGLVLCPRYIALEHQISWFLRLSNCRGYKRETKQADGRSLHDLQWFISLRCGSSRCAHDSAYEQFSGALRVLSRPGEQVIRRVRVL
jgi:hypothetical protein